MGSIVQAAKDLGFVSSPDPIQPGDTYLAERNTGPHLLTCHKVKNNYIVPVEMAYCYDVWECIKIVTEAD